MRHPFKVGKKYRNRHDKYEVVSLEEPKMVIQYSDGEVLETSVKIQARIWRNIQMEKRVEERRRKKALARRRRKRGGKFKGLQENDFQEGVKGTSWRARTNLGGLLAQRMSEITKYTFQSYAVNPWPEVHIVQPSYYDRRAREKRAKFIFELDEQCARYGFYIEKKDGPMDDEWDWSRFLSALDSDTGIQQEIEAAMRELELLWEIYISDELTVQVRIGQENLVWEGQDTASPKGKEEDISWSGFVSRLRAVEVEQWCKLSLRAHMDKVQAMVEGVHIAVPVTKVYQALLPLYEDSVLGVD
jgi:hypothetical protein